MKHIDFELAADNKPIKRDKVNYNRELNQEEITNIILNRIDYYRHDNMNEDVITELSLILEIINNGGRLRKAPAIGIMTLTLEYFGFSFDEVFTPMENGYLSQKKEHTKCRMFTVYLMYRHTPLNMTDIMEVYFSQSRDTGRYLIRRLKKFALEDDNIVAELNAADCLVQEYMTKSMKRFKRKGPITFDDL